MKTITLSQGYVALVDDEDYDWLSERKWTAQKSKSGKIYAVGHTKQCGAIKRKRLSMHREIAGTPPGMDTDHHDGDGLNNQKYNLRVCTRTNNKANTVSKKPGKFSIYKGVCRYSKGLRWQAYIRHNTHMVHLGVFDTEEAAAAAYNKAASELFGEFALLNNIAA